LRLVEEIGTSERPGEDLPFLALKQPAIAALLQEGDVMARLANQVRLLPGNDSFVWQELFDDTILDSISESLVNASIVAQLARKCPLDHVKAWALLWLERHRESLDDVTLRDGILTALEVLRYPSARFPLSCHVAESLSERRDTDRAGVLLSVGHRGQIVAYQWGSTLSTVAPLQHRLTNGQRFTAAVLDEKLVGKQ
jgi:hypothetical protein